MAWQAVADDANRGTLGELEPDDIRRIQRELNQAKAQIEERVWSSYNHLLIWDANGAKLTDIILGQLHPSEARTITSAILARLRHDSLVSREIGGSYVERNWPPGLRDSGAWPLASLKSAFFQGGFTRLENAEQALRQMIIRAVELGNLGLASGKDAKQFDRVWWKESVDSADVTFDFDAYLLTAAKARQLKEQAKGGAEVAPAAAGTTGTAAITEGEKPKTGKPPKPAEAVSISWTGEIARDQWNLFALKVLSRLAQAEQLNITVSISGKLKPEHDVNALNDALKQLGITGEFNLG